MKWLEVCVCVCMVIQRKGNRYGVCVFSLGCPPRNTYHSDTSAVPRPAEFLLMKIGIMEKERRAEKRGREETRREDTPTHLSNTMHIIYLTKQSQPSVYLLFFSL